MSELKILFATDFSPNSKTAMQFIKKMANVYKTELTLIHVIQSFWKDWFASGEYQKEASQRLLTWQSELTDKNKINNLIVEYGNPADVILQHATKEKINLVLLGARAVHESGQYRTGSTIENVVRYAKQSVFICKKNTVSNILCGIDGSEPSAIALQFSMDLARRFSASLCIVSALPSCECNPFGMSDSEIKKCEEKFNQEETVKLNTFLERFDFSDIKMNKYFIPGIPANVVLDRAEDFDHDVIVVGAKGHSLLQHVLIGSTAEKVLRYAPCSLLVVRQ